ncbi:unnamed protein product [Closterium sp. NIES-64]|nr:unnamed protein product [Closterium sp. NIES-64]
MDTEYCNISLKAKLTKEMERAANEKIDFLEELEKRDDTIASLTVEITRPSEGGSADSANMGAGADGGDDKPPPPPQTDVEASYELNVVQPWREAKTVMDAVRQLRASDGDADTEAVVETLHRIAASGIGTFADALTVLKPGTAPMLSKEPGLGVKGLGPKVVSKVRLACALVALNLKQIDWIKTLFPDTWEEQMPKTKADLAKPTAPAKSTAPAKPTAPVHRPPTKRKKSA